MINVIKRYFGHDQDTHKKIDKSDDFANFFYNAKASEKKRLMKRVMQRATKDQLSIIKKAEVI